MRYILILCGLAALALAGCNPAAGQPATPAPSATAQLQPTATPTATPQATPSAAVRVTATASGGQATPAGEPVIVYKRSGGFVGRIEQWSVYAGGRIVAPAGERQVPAERVAALIGEIEAAGFFQLADSYGKGSPCRDCFTVELSVRKDDKLKKVTAVMEAADTPAALREIVGKVDRLVRGDGAQRS